MTFEFQTDESTERLLNVSVHFLQEYFGYEEVRAIDLVNSYYNAHKYLDDDDYYHHVGPFEVAVLVHYFVGLQGEGPSEYRRWKKDKGPNEPPSEAMDYAREHFGSGEILTDEV